MLYSRQGTCNCLTSLMRIVGLFQAVLILLSVQAVRATPTEQHATRRQHVRLPGGLQELRDALQTMQSAYFELWLGTWPTSIDWTAAVIGTHVSASLHSLSQSHQYNLSLCQDQPASVTSEAQQTENEINKYFSQAVAYYFGEDAFSLRQQAYDDMLWVVLGWLQTIHFIQSHGDAHYPPQPTNSWYGNQFTSAFAHRARIFYNLAKRGWDEGSCRGGMIWNPRAQPYKNTITNQLYITASVSMYLNFPGDGNSSPFLASATDRHTHHDRNETAETEWYAMPHETDHLLSAIRAYSWLHGSNLTNHQGLYVDGYHISHYPGGAHGICDQRDETVYTYNQGVILSGLRGLWESTGNVTYLEHGHELVRNVILATGHQSSNSITTAGGDDVMSWQGLGRHGVLEDFCDSRGDCSQDTQMFKGIFFHHLTLFCEQLPLTPRVTGVSKAASKDLAALHSRSCLEYSTWVTRNAVAALGTRNGLGRFGMWWGSSQQAADQPEQHVLDPNDRGRGRTVETQSAGVAVVRAMWEFIFQHGLPSSPHVRGAGHLQTLF